MFRKLIVALACVLVSTTSYGALIQRSFDLELGDVVDDPNRDGVILLGVGFFFLDDPILASVGDSIVIDLFFPGQERIQVHDFGDPTTEIVSIGLGTQSGEPPIAANWFGTLTMLGVSGNAGPNPQARSFNGGGGGIGFAAALNLTDSQVNFSGVRLQFDIFSGPSGFPASFTNITGLQLSADDIRVVPVPEPATLSLLCAGMLAMCVRRRRVR